MKNNTTVFRHITKYWSKWVEILIQQLHKMKKVNA